jgi:hypothetical protein
LLIKFLGFFESILENFVLLQVKKKVFLFKEDFNLSRPSRFLTRPGTASELNLA